MVVKKGKEIKKQGEIMNKRIIILNLLKEKHIINKVFINDYIYII